MDDSGLLLILLGDDEEGLPYTILERYSREDEWKTIQRLSADMFSRLGVRSPDFVWRDYSKKKEEIKNDNQKKRRFSAEDGTLFG